MKQEEKTVRDELVFLLSVGHAHMKLDDAVKNFPMDNINDIYPNGTYSPWDLLEHIRRTQNDILEFIINSNYKDKEWPKDYWPPKNKKAKKKDWDKTIKGFHEDMETLVKIIKDPKTDLYAKIPHGTGQNIFREITVIADHNSYHIGEFAIMRQTMKTWNEK